VSLGCALTAHPTTRVVTPAAVSSGLTPMLVICQIYLSTAIAFQAATKLKFS